MNEDISFFIIRERKNSERKKTTHFLSDGNIHMKKICALNNVWAPVCNDKIPYNFSYNCTDYRVQ